MDGVVLNYLIGHFAELDGALKKVKGAAKRVRRENEMPTMTPIWLEIGLPSTLADTFRASLSS